MPPHPGTAFVPGSVRQRRRPTTEFFAKVAGDSPTVSSTYTSERLQRELLALLQTGPKGKTELRDLLGVNEDRIFTELQALRKRGVVAAVGQRLIARKWALVAQIFIDPIKITSDPKPRKHRLPRPLEDRYKDLLK